MIGKKFVLWRTEFRGNGYKDQLGISHKAYVVLEQIPVTITEVKKVPDMWSDKQYEGWKAVSETGEEFTCNWNSFPSDSMTPTYFWKLVKTHGVFGSLRMPVRLMGWVLFLMFRKRVSLFFLLGLISVINIIRLSWMESVGGVNLPAVQSRGNGEELHTGKGNVFS
jgi:hypothetical protein